LSQTMIRSFVLASVALVSHAAAQDALVDAQECRPRSGLPNFFAKTEKEGASLKVAYLGGSITAAPGWRVQTLEHFKKMAPKAGFSEVHAAIGGTGSDLGVFRLGQDVLAAKPDLLFVEFAVNDGGSAPEQIHRCMEGIVRQTWRALPECDICFVYTVSEPFIAPLLEGKFQRSASAMEAIANHYAIPSIHMGLEVARLAKEGRLEWRGKIPKPESETTAAGDRFVFAGDGVHPHVETGHKLYTEAVVRSLAAIRDAGKSPGPHVFGEPFRADNFERARLVPVQDAALSAGFSKPAPGDSFASRFSKL
jgi:lysophospholipase L1-like esterase